MSPTPEQSMEIEQALMDADPTDVGQTLGCVPVIYTTKDDGSRIVSDFTVRLLSDLYFGVTLRDFFAEIDVAACTECGGVATTFEMNIYTDNGVESIVCPRCVAQQHVEVEYFAPWAMTLDTVPHALANAGACIEVWKREYSRLGEWPETTDTVMDYVGELLHTAVRLLGQSS